MQGLSELAAFAKNRWDGVDAAEFVSGLRESGFLICIDTNVLIWGVQGASKSDHPRKE